MHFHMPSVGELIGLAAVVVASIFAHRGTSVADHERAAQLDTIARGAAAQVLASIPDGKWSTLLAEVCKVIAASGSAPTNNAGAIERAAAAALLAWGVKK